MPDMSDWSLGKDIQVSDLAAQTDDTDIHRVREEKADSWVGSWGMEKGKEMMSYFLAMLNHK